MKQLQRDYVHQFLAPSVNKVLVYFSESYSFILCSMHDFSELL